MNKSFTRRESEINRLISIIGLDRFSIPADEYISKFNFEVIDKINMTAPSSNTEVKLAYYSLCDKYGEMPIDLVKSRNSSISPYIAVLQSNTNSLYNKTRRVAIYSN